MHPSKTVVSKNTFPNFLALDVKGLRRLAWHFYLNTKAKTSSRVKCLLIKSVFLNQTETRFYFFLLYLKFVDFFRQSKKQHGYL